MLVGVDLVVSLETGGAEDGSPSWGSPTDISCAVREYSSPNRSITVDTTTRCATMVTSKGIRAQRDVNLTVDIPDSGTPYFGTGVNTYARIAIDLISSASTETMVCVVRENEISAPADGRQQQRVRLEVQSVS